MIHLCRLTCLNSLTPSKATSKFLIDRAKFTSQNGIETYQNVSFRAFASKSGGFGDGDESFGETGSQSLSWNLGSFWSTGLTKEHFDGSGSAQQTSFVGNHGPSSEGYPKSQSQSPRDSGLQEVDEKSSELRKWGERMRDTCVLLKQVREPGARGSYLKDSEKAEMHRLHKENPEIYTVERLAKDFRIMRHRVHVVLLLKELEADRERKLGHPHDDSIDLLIDKFPNLFNSHDREFHVAALPYKPDFKVMPEGWDGTIRDKDEVPYEISKKEGDMLYRDFVSRMDFSKKIMSGGVKGHKYSRTRSSQGWNTTMEKLVPKGKRRQGGGWKFVRLPDGSSRALNEMEKLYVKRETPRLRRKFLPPNAMHSSIVK